jgi:mediator of RNA polymerase II transcription subunit 5
VDTFLLPSLVTAITYLASQLWIDKASDQKAIIKILQLILLPTSISNEAQTMLTSVLNIVAKPLEHALRTYQRREPKSQDVEPLLRALKDSIPLSRRTGGADHNELEAWTSTPNGGFTAALRHTIQGFVQWSLHPGINVMPTSYTHRQMLVGLKMLTAKRVLGIIVDETKHQLESASGAVVYDVATALICAPDVTNDPQPVSVPDELGNVPPPMQRRLNLREVLKFEAEDCVKIQKSDPTRAEILVRLYRRAEAQMAVAQSDILQGGLSLGLDAGAASSIGQAMAAAAAVEAVVQADVMTVDGLGLDIGAADMGLGGASGSAGGSLDLGADADLFGGLGGGMDIDWGDAMDML